MFSRERPTRRLLAIDLIALVFIIVSVIATFRLIEERRIAALVAGSQFIFIGTLLFAQSLRLPHRRTSLLFWSSLIFLFGVALPMVIQRLRYWNHDFSEISIWGISGPHFHSLSNGFYLLLIAGVIAEWIKVRAGVRKN